MAARLDGATRDTDALGRLGGDEFVVVAEGVSLAAGPDLIAERLLEAFEEPFQLDGAASGVFARATIGIATSFRGSAEDILRDADVALLRAKRKGKGRHLVFEAEMSRESHSRLQVQMDLQGALAQDEFELLYQPIFDLEKLAPVGVEALIRWRRPDGEMLEPADFVPLLEESGQIVEVGAWVLATACQEAAGWKVGESPIDLAVNVSAVQLGTDELIDHVASALASGGMEARRLTIEITETALMHDVEETLRRLASLKQLGVRIAVDDFGTGYSSLAYLRQFPVDTLKIDRSFVSDQGAGNREGEVLLRSMVQLGQALSMKTTAEGIELPGDLQRVRSEACDLGQGFLFNRPLGADAAASFIGDWSEPRRFELRERMEGLSRPRTPEPGEGQGGGAVSRPEEAETAPSDR